MAGSPDEALALTWQASPGVVFDLDTFDESKRLSEKISYEQFEELFILTASSSYNRRWGWRWYHRTLSRETVVAKADFLILNDADTKDLPGRLPGHALVATIKRDARRDWPKGDASLRSRARRRPREIRCQCSAPPFWSGLDASSSSGPRR